MADLSIRRLDDRVKERLRRRAVSHGRSMEAEVRAILNDAVREPGDADGPFHRMLERFADVGGVDLDLPRRSTPPRAAVIPE